MESLRESDQKVILGIIACAGFMATLDSTIVNISLPTISEWYHVDIGIVSWVVMAYLLTLSGLMLAFGRIGDIKGFRAVFLAGFAVFTISSLLCGLSWSISTLILFRILQGAGASAVQAIIPAMIALYLPAEKRGFAFGILMTVVSLGIAGGPVLGGYITEYLSWHWIFFINVPIGIGGVMLATRYLPRDLQKTNCIRFDTIGAVLILAALVTLLLPLNRGLYSGWASLSVIGSFCGSFILWILFYLHERRYPYPLIDIRLFSSRNYLLANSAGMLIILVFAGAEFLLPFYLENVHGFSTEIAGMFLGVPALALIVAGPVAGKVSDRYGSRGLMIGAALMAGGVMLLFSLFEPDTGIILLIFTLAAEGCAVGLFMPPNMNLIMSSVRREYEGVGSSVMMTIRNMGGVFGIALFGTIATSALVSMTGVPHGQMNPDQLMSGFHSAFFTGVFICILTAGISLLISRQETRDTNQECGFDKKI